MICTFAKILDLSLYSQFDRPIKTQNFYRRINFCDRAILYKYCCCSKSFLCIGAYWKLLQRRSREGWQPRSRAWVHIYDSTYNL